MRCLNCGAEMPDRAIYCASCGYQNKQPVSSTTKTTVSNQPNYTPKSQIQFTPVPDSTAPYTPAPYAPAQNTPAPCGPALKFATDRSLAKMFFLSLITLGIYGMVHQSRMADEINIVASRYDGRKTMPFFSMTFASPYTLFILLFVWNHKFANRIGDEARRRGYNTSFGAKDYWLWNILGSLIIVGPFIYTHKLCKNMNMVNESYNYYG